MAGSRARAGALLIGASLLGCGAERGGRGVFEDPATSGDPRGAPPRDGDPGDKSARAPIDRLDPQGPGTSGPGVDAGGSSGAPGPALCGAYRIPVTDQVPEILVVLDRSGSMRENGVDRWGPSVSAVEGAVQALGAKLHFGLLMFPGDCSTLSNPDEQLACTARLVAESNLLSCEPGRLNVPVALHNEVPIREALHRAAPLGATPTAAAIQSASETLLALPVSASTGSRSILLVTDGAPNCALGVGGLLGVGLGPSSAQPEAVAQTVDAIADAANDGIKTHVIGYDTQTDAYLRGTLDRMAAAGGTGASTHTPVEDQSSLLATLSGLARRSLRCDLQLNSPTDPAQLRVTLDGVALPQDPVDGWAIAADGVSLSLRGSACSALDGMPDRVVKVEVLCTPPADEPDAGGPFYI